MKVARQSKTTRGSFRVYACALIRSAGPTLLVGPIMLEIKSESVREQQMKPPHDLPAVTCAIIHAMSGLNDMIEKGKAKINRV